MRGLLLLVLCTVTAHAQPDRLHRLADASLAITLPADFETAGETALGADVSVQIFSRLGAGDHPSPNTYVIVETHRRLSPLDRFLFRRGIGIQRQSSSIAFERINVDRLPLAEAVAAGSAFLTARVPEPSSVGLVVRGCRGDACYAISAHGPSAPAANGMAYAPLLAGLDVTD